MLLLLLVEPVVAPVTVPANPKAGPEIVSVEIHNDPIIKPPAYTTNPYSGEEQIVLPGGPFAPNGSITITLKNYPFTSYTDQNDNHVSRYYSFFLGNSAIPLYTVYQSDSAYTVVTFTYGLSDPSPTKLDFYADGGLIVFRIQSVIGYFKPVIMFGDVAVFEGEGSELLEFVLEIPSMYDKSGTSKPDIQYPSNTPSTSTPSPLNPWTTNMLIIITTVCIITIPLFIVLYLNKHHQKHTKSHNSNHQHPDQLYKIKISNQLNCFLIEVNEI